MAAAKGGKVKKGARRARKAAPKPGARAGKGDAGITKGAAAAGGAAKLDAARVRAWRLDGGENVSWDEHKKRWHVYIHYGKQLTLGRFKIKEDAIALLFLAEDRIGAGCHPKTGKYVPEAERPKPPKRLNNNTHLLGAPAATFSDAALGKHATDVAAKVDAGTLDIDQVAGVSLHKKKGKWYAQMRYNNTKYQLGSQTSDLAEAIHYRLLAEKAKALFPDKNPQDYVAARIAAAGAGKKRKRADADRAEGAAGGAAAATASPRPRAPPPPPPAVPSPSLAEQLAAAQEMLATERKARRVELRAVMAAREREAEAHRVEAERLRAHLASLQREAAALRTVGGDDGQCARSRPYYWQR